jgi:hypothetical protein
MLTYINSYRSRLGGFFFVERWSSAVIFLLSRTSTFAEKIVKTTLEEWASKRLIDPLSTGNGVGDLRGVEDPPNPAKSEEKNPLVWLETVLSVSILGFSEPTAYTHRTTSVLM